MSQLWYAEGEEAQKALAALAAGEQESQTTLPAMYRQMDSGRRGASGKMLVWVTLAALAIVAALVGVLAWKHRNKGSQDAGAQERIAAAGQRTDARVARDAGSSTQGVDARPISEKDASVLTGRDAAILSLPPDELLVPGGRKGAGGRPRTGSGRKSRSGHSHGRATSRDGDRLPRPPDEVARPGSGKPTSTASKEIAAGRTALRRGDLAGAKAHFLKAKSLGGGSRALSGLGEVAFEQGRYGEAVRLLKRASRSGSVHSLVLLGDAYFKSGKLRQAKAAYERALRKSPSNRAAKRNLEIVRRRLGESR